MSLLEVRDKEVLHLPVSTDAIVADNLELGIFLNELNRPIGLIPAEHASRFVLAASLDDSHARLMTGLTAASALPYELQRRHLRGIIQWDTTEFGDRCFSFIHKSPDSEIKHRYVQSLLFVEGKFLFGHTHVIINKNNSTKEFGIRPLREKDIDDLNALGHIATHHVLAS